MKAIKQPTKKENKEEYSISIKKQTYKFKNEEFKINESGDYFTIDIIRFIDKDTNKIIIETLLKTLKCYIKNKDYTYKNLREDKIFRTYLRHSNKVNFINQISLNLNNKNWFNYETESGVYQPLRF